MSAYYFTCALTGDRLDTETTSIVQAAHIHQHAVSSNNDPRNGLALTKTAHWLFDRGFWSLSDDLHVLVKKQNFHESGDLGLLLKPKDGNRIGVSVLTTFHPDPDHLAWHRKQHRF